MNRNLGTQFNAFRHAPETLRSRDGDRGGMDPEEMLDRVAESKPLNVEIARVTRGRELN